MNDHDVLRELWGGLIWGDCVGRMHRGWSPEAMDSALGEKFFRCLMSVQDESIDWQPVFRGVEPVQRRAFVELGLYGHSTQLAFVTGALLASDKSIGFWAGFERAMDLDVFRSPNHEIGSIMYRICRRRELVTTDCAHLFFPMLLVIAQYPESKIEPLLIRQLSVAYASFRQLLLHLESNESMAETANAIRRGLDRRFGQLDDVPYLDVSAMIRSVDEASSVESAWVSVRASLNKTAYLGSTFGLLLAAKFGSADVVPWHRLKQPSRLDDLINRTFVSLDQCATIEAKLSHDESSLRDEYLAERRAG